MIEFLHPHLQSEVIFANIQFIHHRNFNISGYGTKVSSRASNIKINNGSKLPDTYDRLFTLIRVDI